MLCFTSVKPNRPAPDAGARIGPVIRDYRAQLTAACQQQVFRYRRDMPKGYRISDASRDEAIFTAQQAREKVASIADQCGLHLWNERRACPRVRNRRRFESGRAELEDLSYGMADYMGTTPSRGECR